MRIIIKYGKNDNYVGKHVGRVSEVCVWVQDLLPDHGKEKAAVKIHLRGVPFDLNGFHSPSLPGSSLDCGAIPVDAVVYLLNENCNAALGISSLHCLSVLTFSVRLVSPTYISAHSLQGTSCTLNPVCFCSGILFFTRIRPIFRVLDWRQSSLPVRHRPTWSFYLDP